MEEGSYGIVCIRTLVGVDDFLLKGSGRAGAGAERPGLLAGTHKGWVDA